MLSMRRVTIKLIQLGFSLDVIHDPLKLSEYYSWELLRVHPLSLHIHPLLLYMYTLPNPVSLRGCATT